MKNNLFFHLFEFFEKYEWNNILHNLIEKIITFSLESDCDEIKKSLFDDANFIEFICSKIKNPLNSK